MNVDFDLDLSLSLPRAATKEEVKAQRLHLRSWVPHPANAQLYFRVVDGGFELKEEGALAAFWPSVDLCESPIEIQFYAAIVGRDLYGFKMLMQHETVAIDRYRLDFAFLGPRGRRLCVEVDGHEFHERTKEQARNDRARDRRLTLEGWRVLRFTGSEVWCGADACVEETIAHIKALVLV